MIPLKYLISLDLNKNFLDMYKFTLLCQTLIIPIIFLNYFTSHLNATFSHVRYILSQWKYLFISNFKHFRIRKQIKNQNRGKKLILKHKSIGN